jgi:hypothetical protein
MLAKSDSDEEDTEDEDGSADDSDEEGDAKHSAESDSEESGDDGMDAASSFDPTQQASRGRRGKRQRPGVDPQPTAVGMDEEQGEESQGEIAFPAVATKKRRGSALIQELD